MKFFRLSQKRKAKLSIFVTFASPKSTDVSFLIPSKPCACIDVRALPLSNVTVRRLVHPSNIYAEMLSSPLPAAKVNEYRFEHPMNAPCAIVETLAGTRNDCSPQDANAPKLIRGSLLFSVNVTDESDQSCIKA